MKKSLPGPDLATLLGVTTRTLFNLRREGMPHRTSGNDVTYPVPAALEWYYRRKFGVARAEESVDDEEGMKLFEAERRRKVADALTAELKLQEMRGQLVRVEAYRVELGEVLGRVRAFVLRHPDVKALADDLLLELRDDPPVEAEEPVAA